MNINRHNYEELFLLYVDNELSAADKKAVEVFVQENPDLLMELTLLQQTIVHADDIMLHKKDWLYMETEITPLQENLLLYADDELHTADKTAVEALLATDKTVQAEWEIIKQTKLQPDSTVIFKDKQSLYRRETGRVVAIKWWRAAAAAVLLGFGLWGSISVYNNYHSSTSGTGELTQGIENSREKIKTGTASNDPVEPVLSEETTATENISASTIQQNSRNLNIEKTGPVTENIIKQHNVAENENIAVQKDNIKKPGNNLPKSYLDNINNAPGNKTIVAGVLPENRNASKISGNTDAVVRTRPIEKINNTNTVVPDLNKINTTDPVMTAIQVVNNETSDENNRYLDVDDDKEKRTALGGFLRKAKRVLERTTNVKTGEGIKIAGFEIAL